MQYYSNSITLVLLLYGCKKSNHIQKKDIIKLLLSGKLPNGTRKLPEAL